MSNKIDGWTLLARIAANPQAFSACDTTAALSSLLLLRSQLVQGVFSRADLVSLANVVGTAAITEVIDNLAGYEALRVVDNVGGAATLGANRGAAAARRWLLACLEGGEEVTQAEPALVQAGPREGENFVTPAAASRALRRHRAMGARRQRSGS